MHYASFCRVGSRRPPAPPAVPPALWYFWLVRALWRWAGSTHVAQSFTPLPPFMAKAGFVLRHDCRIRGMPPPEPPHSSAHASSLLGLLSANALQADCSHKTPTISQKLPKIPTVSHKAVNHGRFPQAESPFIRLRAFFGAGDHRLKSSPTPSTVLSKAF